MTVPKFDFMESAEGSACQSPLYDQNGNPLVLDDATDSVEFRWWFEGDSAAARIRPAVIVGSPSNIVRYVHQFGDLDQGGKLLGQWVLDVPGTPFAGPTEPVEWSVGSLVGP